MQGYGWGDGAVTALHIRTCLGDSLRMTYKLFLRDREFAVAKATLSAALPDPYWCDTYNRGQGKRLILGLDVTVEPRIFEEELWGPHFYHETLTFPGRDWRSLAGQRFSWDQPWDAETDEANGGVYVWEHADIPRAELVFGQRDGFDFELMWSGVCNVFWDKADFGEFVPFSLSAKARFTHVDVQGSAADDAGALRARLGAYLNPEDFSQGDLKEGAAYQNRVRMLSCKFTPTGA